MSAKKFAFGMAAAFSLAFAANAANAVLIAHWPLTDGPAGSIVTGALEVIDGNTGVHKNGVVSRSGNGTLGNDTWVFDATLDRIVLSTTENNRLDLGQQGIQAGVGFTWALWVNTTDSATQSQFPNDDSGANTIIGNRQGGAAGAPFFKLEPGDLNTNGFASVNFSPDLPDGNWHHVVISGTGSEVRVFIDGVDKGFDNTLGTAPTTNPLFIGGNPSFSGEDLTGLMSDVAIWNEGLTANETKSFFDVASNSLLHFTAGDFELLKNVHDAGTGFVVIDNLRWSFATGLTGLAGLSGTGPLFTLVMNAAADTGLVSSSLATVPEPASASLALLGLAGLTMRRRRLA